MPGTSLWRWTLFKEQEGQVTLLSACEFVGSSTQGSILLVGERKAPPCREQVGRGGVWKAYSGGRAAGGLTGL